MGDKHSEGVQQGNLGTVYQNQGRLLLALDHFKNSMMIFEMVTSVLKESVWVVSGLSTKPKVR